jgi:DNA-binding Lrp family transcriptional regulator
VTQPESTLGLNPRDARLIERLHGNLPLSDHPFAAVGAQLGMDEDEVLERLRRLLSQGVLTRFGPLYQIERAGGCFVLAALEVPAERFAEVAQIVNAQPEVAHNYQREHAFNMWFVVAAESAARAEAALARVAELTSLPVHAFPKEREYFVELRLPITHTAGAADGTR